MQYKTLNDAQHRNSGLRPGTTEIWYNRSAVPSANTGSRLLAEICTSYRLDEEVPKLITLATTHVHLGSIAATDLESIYGMMQGEIWSPEGEANELILNKGLTHTSMHVGDVIKIGNRAWVVRFMGFTEIT